MAETDPIQSGGEGLTESFSFLAETRSCLASPELRRSLRTTRTWMLTLAVLACGWFGLMSLSLLMGTALSEGFGSSNMLGFVFLLSLVLVFGGLPVALMFQFSARTRRFITTSNLRDFLVALQVQRYLWNILGVYGFLIIVLNLVAIGRMLWRYVF